MNDEIVNRRGAEAQKISGITAGLLINFNVPVLKHGVKRIVNNFQENSASPRLRG